MIAKIQNIEIEVGNEMLTDDRLLYFSIFDSDESQKQEMDSFIKASEGLNTLMDVGCAYGSFSFVFASINKNGKVYAFDGSKKVISVLNETLSLNPHLNILSNVALVGNINGMVPCMEEKHQTLVGGNSAPNMVMVKIDTFCQENNITYDAMKIDTEGYEYNVLLGAEETISQFKPMLFMEVHPNFIVRLNGQSIADVYSFFTKHGYSAYDSNLNKIDDYYNHLRKETTDSNRTIWAIQ